MRWFSERFSGWIIRIGPDAEKRPDPYLWALPLSDDGEFVGVSTTPLNCEAVREAKRAANALGFEHPRGLHKEKDIMAKVKNFTKAELAASHIGHHQYDRKAGSLALQRLKDANDAEQITLINRLIAPPGDASDGSGKKSMITVLEWRLDDHELEKQHV